MQTGTKKKKQQQNYCDQTIEPWQRQLRANEKKKRNRDGMLVFMAKPHERKKKVDPE